MDKTSYIQISRSSYKRNFHYLRKIIGEKTRFTSVIKGNAYGHGIENMIEIAGEAGVNHFAVFSADEAYRAHIATPVNADIMVMGYLDDSQLSWAIENGIEFYVFDKGRLLKALEFAKAIGKPARIHLEIETGFHRTGFEIDKLDEIVALILKNAEFLCFEGLCTHYAGAENIANHFRVMNQYMVYSQAVKYFEQKGLRPRFLHTAGSAASLTYPETIMDMVRIGIAQYGFWPSPETLIHRFKKHAAADSDLKRLISWKSSVMAVKEVEAGDFVGYGTSFMANKKMRIAVIPVGYSNGFSRSLSNTGRVLIRGHRVSVIGTVTMNTMTVNVTDIPSVEPGDEVVLIGKQKRLSISIASFC